MSFRISDSCLCKADMVLGTSHQLPAPRPPSYKVRSYQSIKCITKLTPRLATLMNHTNLVNSVKPHLELNTFHRQNGRKYTIGETNSISGQGAHGVSDVFGSALWLVDYCLYIASQVFHLVQCTSSISWLIHFRVLPGCICTKVHHTDMQRGYP